MSLVDWAGLAVTTFAASLLQAAGGFGFAVVAVPLICCWSSRRARSSS